MMKKKLLVLIACAGLAFHTTGCTSNDSKPDADVTSDFDSADLEKLEGDEALDIASDDSLSSDSLAEDALGESAHSEVTTTTETTTTTTESTPGMGDATTERTDVATTTETLPADPFAESSTSAAADISVPSSVDSTETSQSAFATSEPDSTTMVESTTSTTTESASYSHESSTPKASVPLQKAASSPWQVGKTWYNTVYFARPGDSLSSVSQMIYGSDKTAELKKGNPTYKSRNLKPGDKVYYNSPHRSDDSSRMITYYEDNGIAPETYIAQEGDNIRKVSKDLLGYDGAWKEVWSSNTVDSKGALSAGTELRFWRGGAVAAAPAPSHELAGNNPPPIDQGQALPPPPPPPEMGMNDMPQDMQAQNDFPPPPPMPEMAPPPPPPDMAMAPPPPPPEAMGQQMHEEPAAGMDSDTTMALAVVGLAAAGLAVLIVMRKKRRQRELEQQAMSDTHVG